MMRQNLKFFCLAFPLFLAACVSAPPPAQKKECVILLHGLARTPRSMKKMETFLSAKGYTVINAGYPSTREPIRRLAEKYVPNAINACQKFDPEKIHFVTHSLGGILVRQYLQNHSLPEGSRIVMLSPPNRGSELADYLKGLWFYKWRNGPAGQELGTDPRSVPNSLKSANADIGIITGNRSFNPLFSQLIPGPDDGKVSVARAKLGEMKAFIVIPATHTFIMNHPEAMCQTLSFLKKGKFSYRPK
ncbi:MAG: alpha/beta hydrolase [Desulfobacterales bacterium]